MSDYTYLDFAGKEIVVGTKVICMDDTVGIVAQIDELDADYDDEFGVTAYGPYIHVQWPDSEGLDKFSGFAKTATWADYPDGVSTYIFEDLEVVA